MLICCSPTIAFGQQSDHDREQALLGCWATSVGVFKTVDPVGVDSGLKTVPSMVRLDSLPGHAKVNRTVGHLLQAIPIKGGTTWQDGYYTLGAGDVVGMLWTTGFVYLSLTVHQAGDTMTGEAEVGTDTHREERAPITLRRVSCP